MRTKIKINKNKNEGKNEQTSKILRHEKKLKIFERFDGQKVDVHVSYSGGPRFKSGSANPYTAFERCSQPLFTTASRSKKNFSQQNFTDRYQRSN